MCSPKVAFRPHLDPYLELSTDKEANWECTIKYIDYKLILWCIICNGEAIAKRCPLSAKECKKYALASWWNCTRLSNTLKFLNGDRASLKKCSHESDIGYY